jgi:hypothetical protein
VKFFDTLLGRTSPAKPDLERLFRLPVAALSRDAALGLRPSGNAGVCFKAMAGRPFAEARLEIEQLLALSDAPAGGAGTGSGAGAGSGADGIATPATAHVQQQTDQFGYCWIIVQSPDFETLVNRVHVVNSTLEEQGYGPVLLCSVFAFVPVPAGERSDGPGEISSVELSSIGVGGVGQPGGGWSAGPVAYFVYLYKQGTFYPFVPQGRERRDLEAEALLANTAGEDLVIEKDKERWFPIWDLPVD